MRKPFDAFFLLGIGCGVSAGLLKFGDKEVRDGVAGTSWMIRIIMWRMSAWELLQM